MKAGLFGIALLLATASPETARQAYERANRLFVEQKFAEALEAVNRALAGDPALVQALTLRAKLELAANRLPEARRDLERAVELEPSSAYAQFMLGFYYYLENDFRLALPPLERARALDPASSRTHFYLALTHEGLGAADPAIAMYGRARTLALEAGTPDLDVLVAYARLLFTLGRYEESLGLVEEALAADPGSRDAHYERGRLALEGGDFARAVNEGEQALRLGSVGTTDRQIHYLLARAYARAGDRERAAGHLAKFQASAPTLRR
jgi:tetratricopeptide (TPR) repeat protein